jgi:hypothetical protein
LGALSKRSNLGPSRIHLEASKSSEIGLGDIRSAIANAIAELKSYDVEAFCTGVGLPGPVDHDDDPHRSKRGYVSRRIGSKTRSELLDLAALVQERLEDPDLQIVIDPTLAGGPKPKLPPARQLIFAALLSVAKPKIVLADAASTDVVIVENAEGRPRSATGHVNTRWDRDTWHLLLPGWRLATCQITDRGTAFGLT